MTSFILIALIGMFIGIVWAAIEYWTEVVRPVNRDILHHSFYERADVLHRKIKEARELADCRRIQSNLISFQTAYHKIIPPRLLDQVVKKLWGELDTRSRIITRLREAKLKPPVIGTLTVNQLLNLR